ncbi:MAG: 3-hydroxyacyl-CoA dehydrogenase family protein [Burkholderiales bacterium]
MSSPSLPAAVPAALYDHPVAAALLNEALTLLGDGISAEAIEAAGVSAGLPCGPLAVLDAMSLDVVDHALHAQMDAPGHGHSHGHGHAHGHDHHHDHAHGHDHSHDHGHRHDHGHSHDAGHGHGHDYGDHSHDHGHAHAPAPKRPALPESAIYVVEKMAHGYKRSGRGAGKGFYDHEAQPPALWSGLKTFERRSKQLPADDVRDRLVYAALSAALGVDASIPLPPGFAQAFGAAVPANATEAVARVGALVAPAFTTRAAALAERFGPRFEPSGEALARLESR